MTPIAAQLVGRTTELEALDQALTELRRGRAAAVELRGEPGMGKTRLLAELAARAEERDHLVLSGSASELEGDLPFWLFVDALDEYVRGLPPRSLAALDDDSAPSSATSCPRSRRSGRARPSSASGCTARCASCWKRWPRPSRSSCCSTICTGPSRARSIRNLFQKLDVSSRVDVARVVERADRTPLSG